MINFTFFVIIERNKDLKVISFNIAPTGNQETLE